MSFFDTTVADIFQLISFPIEILGLLLASIGVKDILISNNRYKQAQILKTESRNFITFITSPNIPATLTIGLKILVMLSIASVVIYFLAEMDLFNKSIDKLMAGLYANVIALICFLSIVIVYLLNKFLKVILWLTTESSMVAIGIILTVVGFFLDLYQFITIIVTYLTNSL